MKGFFQAGKSAPIRGVLLLFILCLSLAVFNAVSTEFFAAPDGTSTGDGSSESPWDLQTALNHPASVAPGDTIWLRGGVYRRNNEVTKFTSSLSGAPDQPITVRQIGGERATIDGSLFQQLGGWVNYWGFEIMNTHSNRVSTESGPFPSTFRVTSSGQTTDLAVSGFDLRAPHVKLINLIVHDSIGGGINLWTNAIDSEVYGSIVYYNGWQGCDRGHGHGIYIQCVDPNTVSVSDSLFLENYAWGIHATATQVMEDNLSFEGNAAFFNGILARKHQGNFLVGPFQGRALHPVLLQNYIYDRYGTSSDTDIGYTGGSTNAVVLQNYFQTSVRFSPQNEGLVLESNTFLSSTLMLNRSNYPNNLYFNTAPQTNVVVVRTNKYESGRAHIIVYNWENQDSVTVDVSDFLPFGTSFEVRNTQNYFGNPVLTGVYEGELLNLPMINLPVAKPIGMNAPLSTAPEFNVFILLPREEPTVPNEAPAISFIPDQFADENTVSQPVSFTIDDDETPADHLNLSVLSSNPELVQNKNIHISGTGSDRVLTIVPEPDQVGSTIITLAVSDGFLSGETFFNFDVLPAEPPDPTNEIGATLSIARSGNDMTIQLQGLPNAEYILRASGSLLNWSFMATVSTDCAGIGTFVENSFLNRNRRFFKAVRQP